MAVRVDVQGQTVGHLSRELARQYRKQLERAGYGSTDAYCDARIRGGWIEGKAGGATTVCSSTSRWTIRPPQVTGERRKPNAGRRVRLVLTIMVSRQKLSTPPARPSVSSRSFSICKGMICDGEVTEGEVAALKRWLAGHPDAARLYPGKTVAERLLRIYADGVITPDERQELNKLLLDLTGETEDHDQPLNLSTRLPFDEPTPTILFDGHEHVFTGRMLCGTRRDCERKVADRGGRVGQTVTKRTNFLVIGPIASSAWLESTHGRKILRAVELRGEGLPLRIVSEEAWIHAIESG